MRHDLQSAQFRFLQFTEILLPEILDTQYNKRKIILYKNKKEKPIKNVILNIEISDKSFSPEETNCVTPANATTKPAKMPSIVIL